MNSNIKNQLEAFEIDPQTTIGAVTLAVRDLDKMVEFYRQIIGLTILEQQSNAVQLGIDEIPFVILQSRPDGKQFPRATGLFHLAILLPMRRDLAHWFNHLSVSQYPLDGAGDHLVSEALYLSDPDGNGIELYCDRPRETWQYTNDSIRMDTLPVDLEALQAEAPQSSFDGLPAGTTMGHIHLKVDDVDKAIAFYRNMLGFDLMATWRGAAFLSAGGYHHHIGVNTWFSRGAPPPPHDALGLVAYRIVLPTKLARSKLLKRLDNFGYPIVSASGEPSVRDPAGNVIGLQVEKSVHYHQ